MNSSGQAEFLQLKLSLLNEKKESLMGYEQQRMDNYAIDMLIQSKFKPQSKVKDNGSLIPRHGGFYDRMDSVLFTAPFAYLFLMLVNYVS